MRALELRCALAGLTADKMDVLTADKMDVKLLGGERVHGEFAVITMRDGGELVSVYLTRETAGELYAWLAEALHTIT